MKIKRLLAMVMTIAMLASLCAVVNAGSDKVVIANYYDTGDWRNNPGYTSGHEGKNGFYGGVSTKPTVSRAPLDLDNKSNWSKVGAVYAKNLDFAVPATKDGDGKLVQDTANTWGMTYVSAKIVEGAKKSDDGNHYPKNETPIITYEVKADKGNYITSLDVTAWGCVMFGGADLTFYVTPECPTKVTDPQYKNLSTFDYLSTIGYVFSAPTNQTGNYKDSTAWKFTDNGKLEFCGLKEQKDTTVYVTAMFNVPATAAGANMTSGTDGSDQIRFMGCKIEAGQEKITAYNPAETTKKEEETKSEETKKEGENEDVDTGDAFVVSVAALAVVSGAAVVLANRKKKEN